MPPRTDDPTIADDDQLWRRIHDKPAPWFYDAEDGSIRLSAVAFLDNTDDRHEVSVNVAQLTTEAEVLREYPKQGLVAVEARVPRSLGHIVAATPENPDHSHRVICPPSGLTPSRRKALARTIAGEATWVILPESRRA